MKIAIIGTGIAGNVAAYRLARDHEVTIFEADDRIGGHTNTIDVEADGQQLAIEVEVFGQDIAVLFGHDL